MSFCQRWHKRLCVTALYLAQYPVRQAMLNGRLNQRDLRRYGGVMKFYVICLLVACLPLSGCVAAYYR